jgi:thiosulfate reductase cytochrome b subunit
MAGVAMNSAAVRLHRRLGPILALLLPAGYLAGMVTVLVDRANWLQYPAHLAVGTALVFLVAAVFVSAGRIQGRSSPWRARHAAAGLAALVVFAGQALLGLAILL